MEHFWLCDRCASVLTLSFERGQGMVTVPLHDDTARRLVASVCLDRIGGGSVSGAEPPLLKQA